MKPIIATRVQALVIVAIVQMGALYPTGAHDLMQSEIADPFSSGSCPNRSISSVGSYIYDAPSKFDGVFWPSTDQEWLSYCPESGYASLMSDFDELNSSETKRISDFLRENFDPKKPPPDYLARLAWAGRIYKLRDKDTSFWAFFYRLSAYWHDTESRPAIAQSYRRKALPLLQSLAESASPKRDRVKYLFLVGEYYRKLGDDERARKYFSLARNFEWTHNDGHIEIGASYYNGLIDEREDQLR